MHCPVKYVKHNAMQLGLLEVPVALAATLSKTKIEGTSKKFCSFQNCNVTGVFRLKKNMLLLNIKYFKLQHYRLTLIDKKLI